MVAAIGEELAHTQPGGFAAGMDMILADYVPGKHIYTCGAPCVMDGVFAAVAAFDGFP